MPGSPAARDLRPLIVFVDLGMMLSFDQLASRLRRQDVEVAHLTVAHNPLARLISRAAYDRTELWADPSDLPGLFARLGADRIVDVQCPEALLDDVATAARQASLPPATIALLAHRQSWQDKQITSQHLAEAGIPVPRTHPASGAELEYLAAAVGMPLVLKATVSSGGEGVRVVSAPDEFQPALEFLSSQGGTVYAEQYLPGSTSCWAAVLSDGAVLDSAIYRTLQSRQSEGASSSIDVVEDSTVSAIGARVAQVIGGAGMVNLDLVRDASGDPFVVDVNLRAWHSVVALSAVGHDFTTAYLASLGLASAPVVDARLGPVHVFPDQNGSELAISRRRGARRFAHDLWGQRSVLPARYLAVQTLLFARRLLDARPRGGASSADHR